MRFRQEITVWDKAPDTPNHVYITQGNQLLGYVPAGTNKAIWFTKPKKQWDVKRRKFRDLDSDEMMKIENITYS